MKQWLATCFATIAICAHAASAPAAQEGYPTRSVRIVVPMPAGSAPDIRVRLVAVELAKILGQQVVIENRPGGGGAIGAHAVVSAAPDGYTLLAAPASLFTILPAQKRRLSFDVNRDLIPIGTVMAEAQVFAVSPKLGVGSFADLIARAKKAPNTIAIGTNPAGSLPHLAAKLIVATAEAPMTIVPYSTGGSHAAIREIMGGRIQAVIEGRPGLKAAIDSGDLKALAIMTSERLPILPNLPTVAETLPGVRAVGWVAICAPRGTPAKAVQTIDGALHKALGAPDLLKRVGQIGTPFRPLFDAELARFIEGEQKLWRPIVAQE